MYRHTHLPSVTHCDIIAATVAEKGEEKNENEEEEDKTAAANVGSGDGNVSDMSYTYLLEGRSALGIKLFLVNILMANWMPPLRTNLYWKSKASSLMGSPLGIRRA